MDGHSINSTVVLTLKTLILKDSLVIQESSMENSDIIVTNNNNNGYDKQNDVLYCLQSCTIQH